MFVAASLFYMSSSDSSADASEAYKINVYRYKTLQQLTCELSKAQYYDKMGLSINQKICSASYKAWNEVLNNVKYIQNKLK